MNKLRFLHVGCGTKPKALTTKEFASDRWEEIRVDIDPDLQDIDFEASMCDLSMIPEGELDAIFSCHSIEHLNLAEANLAAREFKRVLNDDGFVIVTCPDLQIAAQKIAEGDGRKTLYVSPAGPITPLDMVFGYNAFVATNPHMTHRWGYDSVGLGTLFHSAGFKTVAVMRNPGGFDLWAIAAVREQSQQWVTTKAREHFPIPDNAAIVHDVPETKVTPLLSNT